MKSVRHFLIDKEWRQSRLAAELDISVSHVSLLLRGLRKPSIALLQQMSIVTRIPIETLLHECTKPGNKKTNGARK